MAELIVPVAPATARTPNCHAESADVKYDVGVISPPATVQLPPEKMMAAACTVVDSGIVTSVVSDVPMPE